MKRFWGKYSGKVEDNVDPLQEGRVRVSVPSVLGGGRLNWAKPCVPYAGSGVGFFMIPPMDANVWVEFEEGNLEYPIWSGCFWGPGEVPAIPAVHQMKVIKTDSITLTLSDLQGTGGVTIELTAGPKITVSATGVEIDNGQGGKITLTGPQVSVNDGALEVS